jgi:cytochrome c oxidase assembly protein subunit 11
MARRAAKRKPVTARAVGAGRRPSNRRVVGWSLLVIAVMFGFGFAMAPLYDTLCRALGIGGKTDRLEASAAPIRIDTNRKVTVEFTGHAMAGLPWEFRPLTRKLEVHPGASVTVAYYARNPTAEVIVGQAAPSVTPGTIGEFFKKIECFCFTQQRLAPGEAREMPVQFIVDPALPPEAHTITLSYGFFNTDKAQAKRFGGAAVSAAPERTHHHGGDAAATN